MREVKVRGSVIRLATVLTTFVVAAGLLLRYALPSREYTEEGNSIFSMCPLNRGRFTPDLLCSIWSFHWWEYCSFALSVTVFIVAPVICIEVSSYF